MKNVEYTCLEIDPYELTKSDREEGFYREVLEDTQFSPVSLCEDAGIHTNYVQMLSKYDENYDTGDKYLRVIQRQKLKGSRKTIEVHALKFFWYNDRMDNQANFSQFQEQFSTLLDVSSQYLDVKAGAFNNDFFTNFRQNTFYFRKEYNEDDQVGRFQLYRHQMTPPQNMPGGYKFKEPLGEQEMSQFFIELEQGQDINDYQIEFVRPAAKYYEKQIKSLTMDYLEFITIQYVLIKRKQYGHMRKTNEAGQTPIMIYKMSDLKKPIVNIKQGEIQKVQHCYWIQNSTSDEKVSFTVCGSEFQYIIEHTPQLGVSTQIDLQVQTKPIIKGYQNHMTVINHLTLEIDSLEGIIDQTFTLTVGNGDYKIEFIHPLHKSVNNSGLSQGSVLEDVQKEIRRKFCDDQKGIIFVQNQKGGVYVLNKLVKQTLLYDLEERDFNMYDQFLGSGEMMLKVNFCSTKIHYWKIKRDYVHMNFEDTLLSLSEEPTKYFQKLVIDQFSRSNMTRYQNNYTQQAESMDPNLYLRPQYLHRSKKNVFLQHNKVTIQGRQFSFGEDNVLIDVGKGLQKIPLYDEIVKSVRLIKYQISFKCQKVVFFFLQRNVDKIEGKINSEEPQSGVYFFLVVDFKKLGQGPIISTNTVVYLILNLNNITRTYYKYERLLRYQDNGKNDEKTRNYVCFEMVSDIDVPVDNWVPFVLSDKIEGICSSRIEQFKTYLCFLDVDYLESEIEFYDGPEKMESKMIKSFYLNQQKTSSQDSLFWDNESSKNYSISLFTRCSNWQMSLFNQDNKQYSARFQVGLINYKTGDANLLIECRELLITFDLKEGISIQTVSLRHISPSRNQFQYSVANQKKHHLHRLIPNLDDLGNITGSYLMMCSQVYYSDKVQVQDTWEEFKDAFNGSTLRKMNCQENYKIRVGKQAEVIHQNWANGGMQKATTVMLAFEEDKFTKLLPLGIIKGVNNKIDTIQPLQYDYSIVELCDKNLDSQIKLLTPIFQMGYQKYVANNRINEYTIVSTSRFNSNIVQTKIFDNEEMLFELYRNQRKNISMSFMNFTEIPRLRFEYQKYCFFQHRYLFDGQSFCSIYFPSLKKNLDKLSEAMSPKVMSSSNQKAIGNSVIELIVGNDNYQEDSDKEKKFGIIMNWFNVNRLHSLQANLNFQSFIQLSLEMNMTRPLYFLIEFMLEKNNSSQYREILVRDLPQLLCQEKVPINIFMNQQHEEHFTQEPCSLETNLNSMDLPFVGLPESQYIQVNSFQNIYEVESEVEKLIIKRAEAEEKDKIDNKENEGEDEKLYEIQHSYINFQPAIRKMKIDMLIKRPANKAQDTDYLLKIDSEPQNIKGISELFLADLMTRKSQQGDLDFYDQSTTIKIIDRQFVLTNKLIKAQLSIFILGFFIPFSWHICYESNQRIYHKDEVHEPLHLIKFLCIVTQIWFLVVEYAEYKYIGWKEYVTDPWNVIDYSQFFIYFIRLIIFDVICVEHHSHSSMRLIKNIMEILLLNMATIKMLQLFRFSEHYAFLVQMIVQVLIDLKPFLAIFFLYTSLFSLVYIVMETKFDNSDYPGLSEHQVNFVQMFRNSIGDIAPMQYDTWYDPATTVHDSVSISALAIIYSFWLYHKIVMIIVLLNFLIAEVSMTYEKVKSSGNQFIYSRKADLNLQTFQILEMFGQKNYFTSLVFTSVKESSGTHNDTESMSISSSIKKEIANLLNKQKVTMQSSQQKIIETINKNHQSLELKIAAQEKKLMSLQNQDCILQHIQRLEKKIDSLSLPQVKEPEPQKLTPGNLMALNAQNDSREIVVSNVEPMERSDDKAKILDTSLNELRSMMLKYQSVKESTAEEEQRERQSFKKNWKISKDRSINTPSKVSQSNMSKNESPGQDFDQLSSRSRGIQGIKTPGHISQLTIMKSESPPQDFVKLKIPGQISQMKMQNSESPRQDFDKLSNRSRGMLSIKTPGKRGQLNMSMIDAQAPEFDKLSVATHQQVMETHLEELDQPLRIEDFDLESMMAQSTRQPSQSFVIKKPEF